MMASNNRLPDSLLMTPVRALATRCCLAGLLVVALAVIPGPLHAEQGASAPASQPAALPKIELSSDQIEARVKQVQEDPALDEAAKNTAAQLYQQALAHLETADKWTAEIENLKQRVADAPRELETIKALLAQPQVEPTVDVPAGASLAQTEPLLAKAQSALSEAKSKLEVLEGEPKRRSDRRSAIAQLAASARKTLEGIERELAAPTAADEPPALTLARRAHLSARERSLKSELMAAEQEIAFYDATVELLSAQRDSTARNVSLADKTAKAWQQVVQERRRQEAEARAREAIRAQAAAHPAVREIAEENARLASRGKDLTSKIERAVRGSEKAQASVTRLREDFTTTKQKVEKTRHTRTIGLLLRRQQEDLPSIRDQRRLIKEIQLEAAETEIDLIDLERDRRPLRDDLDSIVAAKLQSLESTYDSSERSALESTIRELLGKRRDYLQALIDDYTAYLNRLNDWETAEGELIVLTESFAGFIDEHIWWIRSNTRLNTSDLTDAWAALQWLTDSREWRRVVGALWDDAKSYPALFAFFILVIILLLSARRRLAARLAQAGEKASQRHCVSFRPTAAAVGYTALLIVPVPLLLWFVAWRLASPFEASEFARALSTGLRSAAVFYLVMAAMREICRRKGLSDLHLGWLESTRRLLRRHLKWLTALGLPTIMAFAMLEWQPNPDWQDSLGRMALVAFLCGVCLFNQRVFQPRTGVLRHKLTRRADNRTRWLGHSGYLLVIAIPLALAILAILGYYYTAIRLARELRDVVLCVLVVLLLYAFALRWTSVAHRRLAIDQSRKRRAAAQKAAAETQGTASPRDPTLPLDEPKLDVSTISDQTAKLFKLMLFMVLIFSISLMSVDLLPAFAVLKSVTLWPGAPITLANLALAIIIVVIAVLLSRNLPGFLEITFLQRLPLDPGGRYAIAMITRYTLLVTGIVMASGMVGLGWSKVQWLVAAITVGLGFGLQEIFANFVSGLIILLERPVRVGDTVTVGDISGTVTRIRIRATTITSWDRKELIIPNKEFVTGQVVNWTLSDSTLRIIVPVGIAYGSDTDLAEKLMLEAAEESEMVLTEPAPQTLFLGFGDSSLNFELRVFVASIDHFLKVKHAMHKAIDRKFREAGVEIAFPQRDIHIRSAKGGHALREGLAQVDAGSSPTAGTSQGIGKAVPPDDASDPA